MSQFRFCFKGQLVDGKTQADVQKQLANLFSVDIEDVAPLFTGSHYFDRNGLDEFSANAYKNAFLNCGAVGEIAEGTVLPESVADLSLVSNSDKKNTDVNKRPLPPEIERCPKCDEEKHNKEHCVYCGIYFEKFVQRFQPKQSEPRLTEDISTQFDEQELDDRKARHRAVRWLFSAASGLTIVNIIDNFFQNSPVTPAIGDGLIIFAYLVVHAILIRGCMLFSESKGLERHYGWLGALSLPGLSILLLLQDKDERFNVEGRKQKLAAILCIGVSLYWLSGHLNIFTNMDSVHDEALMLAEGRSEYPSTVLDSDQSHYESEYREILTFVDSKLLMAYENKLRKSQLKALSAEVYQALSRFIIWQNYQHFLHYSQGVDLPEHLTLRDREKYQELQQLLDARVFNIRDDLYIASEPWFYGGGGDWENPNQFWFDLKRSLMDTQQQLNLHRFKNTHKGSEDLQHVLEDFDIPVRGKIKAEKQSNMIRFTALMGPLAKKPVVVGLYFEESKRPRFSLQRNKGQSAPKHLRMMIISHELPHYRLYAPYNVLSDFLPY